MRININIIHSVAVAARPILAQDTVHRPLSGALITAKEAA